MATRALRKTKLAEPATKDHAPSRWWQWFLIYPALGISLVSAAPQWIDKIRATIEGVRGDSLQAAIKQNDLWKKNITCLSAPGAWFEGPNDVQIDATICNSGDIFVQAMAPGRVAPQMHWVAVEDVLKDTPQRGNPLVPAANAATPSLVPQAEPRSFSGALIHRAQFAVLCQKFIDGRHIKRRVQTPQGCFDEIIDTYNGAVVQRNPAPCTPQC